ncbi:MAG: toll/interleukin-1 receptor domain-containing protein [Hyphomicrobiaceae bacterium]
MIFISYRRHDCPEFVDALMLRLRAKLPDVEVFKDTRNLRIGVDFRESIIRAIWQSTIMLVVIGPGWNAPDLESRTARLFSTDDVVRLEIQEGLNRHLLMIPLVFSGAAMPRPRDLPEVLHDLCLKGAWFLRPGNVDEQLDEFITELDSQRNHIVDEFISIGGGLVMEGSPKKAISYYSQAATLAANNGRIFRQRAFAYDDCNEITLALNDYNRAIELDPNDALAWAGRSNLHSRANRLELALQDINRAVELTISSAVVYSIRANLYRMMGRHLDRMKDLANCIILEPDNVAYRLRRIEAYVELRHPELAAEDVERVLAIDPSNAELRALRNQLKR